MTFEAMTNDLTSARARLIEVSVRVSAADAARKPTAGAWSVVEVLDHVARVESLIAALLTQLFERARRRGRLTAPAPDDLPLRTALLAPSWRYDAIPAFPGSEPSGRIDRHEALDRLAASRDQLLRAAAAGVRYDCSSLIAPHFVGRLNFYEWIYFTAVHDELHRGQVEERLAQA